MASIPYAAVTVLDTAANVTAGNATIIPTDFRFAGENTVQVIYAASFTSIGAGDSLTVQVSPDYDEHAPTAVQDMAMWAQYGIVSAAGVGSIVGPWAAFRILKPGANGAKVVAVVAGKNRSRYNRQG